MLTITLRDAKATLPKLVDRASKGEFVTITRYGRPVAALVPVEAAEIGRKATEVRTGFAAYLKTFPGGEIERNPSPSREIAR